MKKTVDKRPTMAEWPVKIWKIEEIPEIFKEQTEKVLNGSFDEYNLVYSPPRPTALESFEYLFGYEKETLFYLRNYADEIKMMKLRRDQILQVNTKRELLNANISVKYYDEKSESIKMLEFPYVPTVYYHYDPLLNWLLGMETDFQPFCMEQKHPRPKALYDESMVMYNYALGAYRLGEEIRTYQYESRQHRKKWMPWKTVLEEWVTIPMCRGTFTAHNFGYLTECEYKFSGKTL